jgi:hypothetical protein
MSGNYFGYPDAASFERAVAAEMAKMSDTTQGREPTSPPPKKQAAPGFKLEGAPDSPERWAQAARLVNDPEILQGALYDRVTGHLRDTVRAIQRAEERGEYDQQTLDKFASAARHLAAIGDPYLYAAFEEQLDGTEVQEHLADAVGFAQFQQANADMDAAAAQEQARLDQREQLLAREYEIAAARHGETAVQAVDGMVRQAEDAFYSPNISDDEVRALARTTAEQVHANEKASRNFSLDAAITEEMMRIAPPGSSWNDEERHRWEQGMRQTVLENYQNKLGDPDRSAERAIASMLRDDRKAETGKGDFERALDAEFAEMYSHSRQGSEHLRKLADENVREWEATHDETGQPTTFRDGLGRESDRRERR